jgi:tetratricopeptide (TPR) repeat protein
LQALAGDPIAFDEAMETLRSFSLIRRIPSAKIIFIHRLVQAVLRNTMHSGEQRQWAERVIRILNRVFPDPIEIEVWPICRRYLPHAQVCTLLIHQWSLKLGEASQLLNQIGYYLQHAHGLYSEAEKLYTFALSNGIQMFGPEHPRVILFLNNLAEIYRIQGQYSAFYQEALKISKQVLGDKHLHVATILNNLAVLYSAQNKYYQAEPLYQRVLHIREKTLGQGHPKVTKVLIIYSALLRKMGGVKDATKLETQLI